jgi:putative nucleotidyltransferase with HDIG domain
MIIQTHVPLHRLILSLSDAMDCANPMIADHQQRVGYISLRIGQQMGMAQQELIDLFHAAVLHDIGLIGVENRTRAIHLGKLEGVHWHEEVGYRLLKDNPFFADAAEAVRYHHISWACGQGARQNGRRVPLATHIVALADAVERFIDRETFILDQADTVIGKVARLAETEFHPDCVDAFYEVARSKAFWLDCVSDRIYKVLLDLVNWPSVALEEEAVGVIAKTFAHIVDASSRWTATHSAGVAASAVALAERFNFSPRELLLMRAAGYLHDIGKLSIPSRILDKPGKLSKEEMNVMMSHTYHTFHILNTIGGMPHICEWAAFHHERLDGKGYPFGHNAQDLTLGARIMGVADVFTAIAETRPYRKSIRREKALSMLKGMVKDNALDGDVLAKLEADYSEINAIRKQEQANYSKKQGELFKAMVDEGAETAAA